MPRWRSNKAIDLSVRVVRAIAIAWVTLFALLGVFQRKLLYQPFGPMSTPAEAGLSGVTEERLIAADGERLIAWSAQASAGKPTLVMFHGNGGTLAQRAHYLQAFRTEGWGFYAFSYRAFSGNSGSPSEAANVADALLAYDTVRARGVAAEDIVLFGESLGSGVAIQVAAQRSASSVVLDSPYSSITDVAGHHYWYLPVSLALRDRYDSTRHIRNVTAPVLIVHGEKDSLIPIRFGRKLADAAVGPVRFVGYAQAEHVHPMFHGAFEDIKAWVVMHHRRKVALKKRS
jgi:uncharacterized protein